MTNSTPMWLNKALTVTSTVKLLIQHNGFCLKHVRGFVWPLLNTQHLTAVFIVYQWEWFAVCNHLHAWHSLPYSAHLRQCAKFMRTDHVCARTGKIQIRRPWQPTWKVTLELAPTKGSSCYLHAPHIFLSTSESLRLGTWGMVFPLIAAAPQIYRSS